MGALYVRLLSSSTLDGFLDKPCSQVLSGQAVVTDVLVNIIYISLLPHQPTTRVLLKPNCVPLLGGHANHGSLLPRSFFIPRLDHQSRLDPTAILFIPCLDDQSRLDPTAIVFCPPFRRPITARSYRDHVLSRRLYTTNYGSLLPRSCFFPPRLDGQSRPALTAILFYPAF